MTVAILGATGYTGLVLIRLLGRHPDVRQIIPVTSSRPGLALTEVDPGLSDAVLAKLTPTNGCLAPIETAVAARPDVVFAALPHLASAQACEPFFGTSLVIDLSADFRIKDHETFRSAYGRPPAYPDLLERAAYGLPEWRRGEIERADLIANPGCYPTATLLALLPFVSAGCVRGSIVVNALSGISGAGRKEQAMYLYSERTENANPYAPGLSHRHVPEIRAQLDEFSTSVGGRQALLFTPHLVPMRQGMEVTSAIPLDRERTDDEIEELFSNAYKSAPFVRVTRGRLPETRHVRNSNRCDISWHGEGSTVLVFSVIDNLLKGASGQAVQNMNVRLGLDETAGIDLDGEF
ncbi:MAG: N-acetyl-gamma-glutamyl-phosphate reductase [Spirochaetaceae bacterium]|nr:MAG: N-acetyl-gamma-glutamyl-phosphate reductase [Spirochaetaceae bacterium]